LTNQGAQEGPLCVADIHHVEIQEILVGKEQYDATLTHVSQRFIQQICVPVCAGILQLQLNQQVGVVHTHWGWATKAATIAHRLCITQNLKDFSHALVSLRKCLTHFYLGKQKMPNKTVFIF
jgi:hypothetical protein